MFPRALRMLRIRGVDVRVDRSLVILAGLVVWSFYVRFSVPGRSGAAITAMAAATTLGLLVSLLGHELGHALEARRRGLHVHAITLFLLGGVTEMDVHAHGPRDEFAVAAIGPYVSLVLASLFGLIAAALDWYVPALHAVAVVTGLLGWMNLALAAFNLIPGAPLDGGRLLRAGLWAVTGRRHRSQVLAARAGMGVAVAVWAAGAWALTRPAGLLTAIWFGVIGLFMFNSARTEHRSGRALSVVDGHTAGIFADAAYGPGPTDEPAGAAGPRSQVAHDAPVLALLRQLDDGHAVEVLRDGAVIAVVDRARADDVLRQLQRPQDTSTVDAPPAPVAGPDR